MYSVLITFLVAVAAFGQAVKKSPVDLLREGRMLEAQRILEQSDAPERYLLLLDALREPNAIEACFLYREISARFPGTDCDEFAQERLLQAASMGIDISSLVLESAPVVNPGEWVADEPVAYEVERPLIASVKRDETPTAATEIAEAPKVVLEQQPPVVAPTHNVPAKQQKHESEPATSATLDYGSAMPTKVDTGIVHSSLDQNKSLIKTESVQEQAKLKSEPAVKVKEEPTRPHDIDTVGPNGWYIQVGAFGNHDNAHKIAARLRTDGYSVYLVPRDNLLQVRVGVFETKEEGRAIGDKIKAKYDVPAVLVTVP